MPNSKCPRCLTGQLFPDRDPECYGVFCLQCGYRCEGIEALKLVHENSFRRKIPTEDEVKEIVNA